MPSRRRAPKTGGITSQRSASVSTKGKRSDHTAIEPQPPIECPTVLEWEFDAIHDVLKLERSMVDYSRLLESPATEGRSAHSLRFHHAHAMDAKAKLEQVLRQANDAARDFRLLLATASHSALENIRDKSKVDNRWYRQQDLMTFKVRELRKILEYVEDVNDAADFASYLREVLVSQPGDSIVETDEKMSMLKDCLGYSCDPSAQFHMLHLSIFLIARNSTPAKGHPMLPSWPEYWWQAGSYWNAAELRRMLYTTYQDTFCDDEEFYEEWYPQGQYRRRQQHCFHARNIGLLQKLQERAHFEVRRAVLMAVGQRFSMELVDLIHERTLQAEELPATTQLYVERDPEDHDYDLDDEEFLEEYQCPRMMHSWEAEE